MTVKSLSRTSGTSEALASCFFCFLLILQPRWHPHEPDLDRLYRYRFHPPILPAITRVPVLVSAPAPLLMNAVLNDQIEQGDIRRLVFRCPYHVLVRNSGIVLASLNDKAAIG